MDMDFFLVLLVIGGVLSSLLGGVFWVVLAWLAARNGHNLSSYQPGGFDSELGSRMKADAAESGIDVSRW